MSVDRTVISCVCGWGLRCPSGRYACGSWPSCCTVYHRLANSDREGGGPRLVMWVTQCAAVLKCVSYYWCRLIPKGGSLLWFALLDKPAVAPVRMQEKAALLCRMLCMLTAQTHPRQVAWQSVIRRQSFRRGGPGWSAATTRVALATRSRAKCFNPVGKLYAGR